MIKTSKQQFNCQIMPDNKKSLELGVEPGQKLGHRVRVKQNTHEIPCRKCEFNHKSIDCCWCDWGKIMFDNTYNQDKRPSYCPLNIIEGIIGEISEGIKKETYDIILRHKEMCNCQCEYPIKRIGAVEYCVKCRKQIR